MTAIWLLSCVAAVAVHLPRHVPILVLYWTASVDPDGTVRFYRDVYGRDAALAGALDARHVPTIADRSALRD